MLGPDEIGIKTFLIDGEGNLPDLMGIEEEHLKQIQDVDEKIDLVKSLGDMLAQKPEAKMDKFISTMPTIIQTPLITGENWATVAKKEKELEQIIHKCELPAAAMPSLTPVTAVPRL